MTGSSLEYQVPESGSPGEIISALSSRFRLVSEPEKRTRHIFHDTFDWRLYQAGGVLDEESNPQGDWLIWRSLEDGLPRETLRLEEGGVPAFAWDFPPGVMKELAAPAMEMRSLLPQVEVKGHLRTLCLLDGEEKTVLRLELAEYVARAPGRGEYRPFAGRVILKPVRGYQKALEKMRAFLADELALHPAPGIMLEEALTAIGRRPLDYSSRLDFRLDPKRRADEVTREILAHLLDTLETNIPGTRADLDSEYLHDLRVAVRRTRSALTQIKGVFPDQVVEEYKERFAWIGQATGPTRDLDVYLLGFAAYRDSLPEPFRQDLDPLHDFLVAHQKSEHRTMVRKINSPHFRAVLKEWREFLRSPVPEGEATANGSKPIRSVAGKRIFKIYQRVLSEGVAIHSLSPPEELHELRKSCKKLRYLMEFFQSLYPRRYIRPLIKSLKILLENLGDFQDLEVQAFKLREFAHTMVKEGEVPADTLLAMGMLVDGLLKRQQLARDEFAALFEVFSREGNQQAFTALFASRKAGKA
jgi:CHAD domain-containing protein